MKSAHHQRPRFPRLREVVDLAVDLAVVILALAAAAAVFGGQVKNGATALVLGAAFAGLDATGRRRRR